MASEVLDEKAIFNIAREIDSPNARAEYLRQACGTDSSLFERVQVLLRAYEEQASFLESPAAVGVAGTADQPHRETPGTVIGPYKLLQQIGEGGMGIVWMAEQTQPVQRKVALKVIKPGMDSRQVIARFEAERQALAMMDHVNIARVFDGGTTPPSPPSQGGDKIGSPLAQGGDKIGSPPLQGGDKIGSPPCEGGAWGGGRPYFVMELVHGVPITKYCDDNHLTPRERLELFVPVCQAIQHAHQKGIIHRDIKPSNVMVTLYDGKPVPKVIDFGVAKATEQKLTERTLFTHYGTMVGTLEYMSPEQAEMSALGVDTRSDIYSLGVLLYELLTGSTPLTHQRMKEAAYGEILRMIKEEEPPKPSTRLSDSGEALASISANRHTEPAKLTKLVRGELDWIVMKALEKDRERRYQAPNSLADDIQHYLQDEPVQACPPSAAYRLRKFVRRNKGPVLAATLVLLALMGGITGTSWGLVRAERALAAEAQRADGERKAKQEAFAAAQAEKQAKENAQMRLAETLTVLEFVDNKIFAAARPKDREGGLGPQVSLRQAVEAALPFVEGSFAKEPLIEARLRWTLGRSFFSLGDAKTAADQFQIAHGIYAKQYGPDHEDTLATMVNLANSYYALGRYRDALKLREQTLTLLQAKRGPEHPLTLLAANNLANSYASLGRHQDALKLHEPTLALQQAKLAPDHPHTLQTMHNLANSYADLGRHEDALKLREQTLARCQETLGPDHPQTLQGMNNLASSYADLGRRQDALKLREKTLTLCQETLGPDHPDTLQSMNNLANSHAALGRHQDALKLREETLALRQAKLGPDHPHTLESMYHLANSYEAVGRVEDALKLREKTLPLRQAKLGPDHPDTVNSMFNLAISYGALGRYEESLKLREETLALRQARLGPDHPDTLNAANALAWLLATAADAKLRDRARAVELAGRACAASPQTPNYRATLGIARYRAGDGKGAIQDLDQALSLPNANDLTKAAGSFFLAMAHWQLGNKDGARQVYAHAAAWMDRRNPRDHDLKRFRAEAAEVLGVKVEK